MAALRDVVAFVTAAFVAAPSDVADVSPLLQRRVLSTLDEVVHRHGGQVVALSLLWLYWSTLEAVAAAIGRQPTEVWAELSPQIEARLAAIESGGGPEDDP
jgi:hypothetical protein